MDNDIRPALVTQVENIDEYDTLIVETPIWSSRLAPPVKSFLVINETATMNNTDKKILSAFSTKFRLFIL